MPFNPLTLKQMKDGTLRTLRLQNQLPLDQREWKVLGNYLRATTSLRELDLSFAHGAFEQLTDSLKANKSLTKLTLAQMIQEHNLPAMIDVLKANPAITQLNLNNCYLQGSGIGQLARFLKSHPTTTHLSMEGINFEEINPGYDRGMGIPKLSTIAKALADSPNILDCSPATPEIESICTANKLAVEMLLKEASKNADQLSSKQVESIVQRLPAFLHTAESQMRKPDDVAQLLVNIEDRAAAAGVAFEIPAHYADRAAALPRPFTAATPGVDFAAVQPKDLARPAANPRIYQAIEAGQVAELLSFLKANGMKLTAADCLTKPEGKRENLIQLIARQGKLAEVMTVDNWLGDPRGLKSVVETVPAREWQRQLKALPADRLIFQVNAASFKDARRPKAQPAGPR